MRADLKNVVLNRQRQSVKCVVLAAAECRAPYLEATAACAQSSAYGCWQRWTIVATSVSFIAMDKNGEYSWMAGPKYSVW